LSSKTRWKAAFILAFLATLLAATQAGANDLVPHKAQRPANAKPVATGGVETIKPREAPTKDTGDGAGWGGSYVGVNAGAGFGATAGTNVVVPFGSAPKPEK
jgi:hypothetical protein